MIVLGTCAMLAGCGGNPPPAATGGTAEGGGAAPAVPAGAPGAADEARVASVAPGSDTELVAPEDTAMVFLYYRVAGLTPPIDLWVEEDARVKFAPGIEKAGKREALRAELNAGAAAVRGVGRIRLTMQADLSDYDPAYGEFTVRALAPSSMVEYRAFGQKVALKFGNGRIAQIWKVPQAEAQAVRDRIGYNGADMDVLLAVTGAQPGAEGGSLMTQVLSYELREKRGGTTIGRVNVAP